MIEARAPFTSRPYDDPLGLAPPTGADGGDMGLGSTVAAEAAPDGVVGGAAAGAAVAVAAAPAAFARALAAAACSLATRACSSSSRRACAAVFSRCTSARSSSSSSAWASVAWASLMTSCRCHGAITGISIRGEAVSVHRMDGRGCRAGAGEACVRDLCTYLWLRMTTRSRSVCRMAPLRRKEGGEGVGGRTTAGVAAVNWDGVENAAVNWDGVTLLQGSVNWEDTQAARTPMWTCGPWLRPPSGHWDQDGLYNHNHTTARGAP